MIEKLIFVVPEVILLVGVVAVATLVATSIGMASRWFRARYPNPLVSELLTQDSSCGWMLWAWP